MLSNQVSSVLEHKAALEQELHLMKEKMNVSSQKKEIAKVAVLDNFRQNLPEDSTLDADAVIEDAVTTSMATTKKELSSLPDEKEKAQMRYEIEEKIKSTKQSILDLEK
jgi:hypothetical protein